MSLETKTKEPKEGDERRSYESEVDSDARAAYDEVMGRIKDATEGGEKGDGEGAASRSRSDKTVKETDDGDSRDSRGRFAGKDGGAKKESAGDPAGQDPTVGRQRSEEPKPAGEATDEPTAQPAASGPPSSFSVKTKSEWAALPEHVRADIIKRETEMGQGLKALQEYKDLKPYAEMATRHNTTIPKALDHFVRMENLIRQDMGQGLAAIVQNSGYTQAQAAELFGKLSQKFGGQSGQPSPQAGAQPNGQAADPLAEALRPILGPMLQPLFARMEQMHGTLTSREQADRNAHAQSLGKALEAFSADPANLYYTQLEASMTQLFEKGMVKLTGNHAVDIKTAYDMAARMHPEVAEALIEQRLRTKTEAQRMTEQGAADKAKAASRSLSGTRAPGTVVVEKDEHKSTGNYDEDLEQDVIRAMRAVKR